MKRSKQLLLSASVGSMLFASTAIAQNPYLKPDDTWVSIDGTVHDVSSDTFELDYGQGNITVEMDDGDRDADGYKLMAGDRVTVSGVVDDDFYESTKIEAASVYVENLGTYFYASSVDEEDTILDISPVMVSATTVQGTVSSVDAAAEEFTIANGPTKLTVEVDEMYYNPLDDEGYQKVSKGDRVSVTGSIDKELFDGKVFDADLVTTLYDKSENNS